MQDNHTDVFANPAALVRLAALTIVFIVATALVAVCSSRLARDLSQQWLTEEQVQVVKTASPEQIKQWETAVRLAEESQGASASPSLFFEAGEVERLEKNRTQMAAGLARLRLELSQMPTTGPLESEVPHLLPRTQERLRNVERELSELDDKLASAKSAYELKIRNSEESAVRMREAQEEGLLTILSNIRKFTIIQLCLLVPLLILLAYLAYVLRHSLWALSMVALAGGLLIAVGLVFYQQWFLLGTEGYVAAGLYLALLLAVMIFATKPKLDQKG